MLSNKKVNSKLSLYDINVLFNKKMEIIEFVRNKLILIQNIIKDLNLLTN